MPKQKVGEVIVDSGRICVVDPVSMHLMKLGVNQLGQVKAKKYNTNIAVVAQTDDGTYPVFLSTTASGKKTLSIKLN